MKKIYVSGPIHHLPREIAWQNFEDAETLLKEDYEVINPMKIPKPDVATWGDCMIADIKWLFEADIIYMLPGWRGSKGARIEMLIATEIGLEIHFADHEKFDPKTRAHIPESEKIEWMSHGT